MIPVLWMRWKPTLAAALTGGVLMAGVASLLPDYYKSEARILPAEAKGPGGLGQLAGLGAALGMNLPGQEGPEATYVDVLSSRWMKEQLLTSEYVFHLRSWRLGAERQERQTLLAYLGLRNLDRGVARLDNLLVANRDFKTKMLSISLETRSPELSQQVIRRAVANLETFVIERSRSRAGVKAAFA